MNFNSTRSVSALLFMMLATLSAFGAASPTKTAPPAVANSGQKADQAVADEGIASAPASTGKKPAIVLLTRAVGEVADHVVTSREVRVNDAVEQAINQKPSVPEGYRVLNGQEKTFPGEVSKVLDEWVVFLEARTLASAPPAKSDITAKVKTVQEFWSGKPAWHELEVANEELREMVERKLVAKEFEKLKSDPNLAPVSDEDALAYYRKNRLRFGSLPFSQFKDNIKAFLVKNQTERRLAEWRDVLRRKYKVRNFIAG